MQSDHDKSEVHSSLQQVTKFLQQLSDVELIALVRKILQGREPYKDEGAYVKSHYFLGIAVSLLISEENAPEKWSQWHLEAIAQPDPTEYKDGLGYDEGFWEAGSCPNCNTELRGDAKKVICPICYTKANLT